MTEKGSSPELKQDISLIEKEIKKLVKNNEIPNPSLRFSGEVKKASLSFPNIFFVPEEKVGLFLDKLSSAKKIAVVVGGAVFSLSELLDVMKENPEISLFIAVDPECQDDSLFFTLREKSYFESKSTNPSQLGLIFPIRLESLPNNLEVDYMEMVSPDPLELSMLVESGLRIIKKGGRLRLYIPRQDLTLASLIDNNSKTPGNLENKIKEYYRKIFKLAEDDILEVKIISEEEAQQQRDSVHFGSFFYGDQKDSVVIISIEKNRN